MSATASVRLEGGLLGPDLVAAVAKGEAAGQSAKDFALGSSARVTDEIARS